MIDHFLINLLLVAAIIAAYCSTLGVFVLWNRLSYLGDALSHASILGVMLGAIFGVEQIAAIMLFSVFFALIVNISFRSENLNKDNLIAISSYFCVAIAILLQDFSFKDFSISNYIFGDIMTVSKSDLLVVLSLLIICTIYMIFSYRKILLIALDEDLAKIKGIRVEWWKISLLLLLSCVIAISTKIVGVFLMTALLILPASIARKIAKSPIAMIWLSLVISLIFVIISYFLMIEYNLPLCPTLVAALASLFFILTFL